MRLTDEQRAMFIAAGLDDMRPHSPTNVSGGDELWGRLADGQEGGTPKLKIAEFAEGWAAWVSITGWDSGYFDDPIAALTYARVENWGGPLPPAKLNAINYAARMHGARSVLKGTFTG